MGNYTRLHKRIAMLDDADLVEGAIGAAADGNWVTAVDPLVTVGNDDYTVNGNRIAMLTESGVLSPRQLPGSYGPQGHVLQGWLSDGVFYELESGDAVTPDVHLVYLDVKAHPHTAVAYRWMPSVDTYVVATNDFRPVGGQGLVHSVDPGTMSRSYNLAIADDACLPADSADDPESPGTRSISMPGQGHESDPYRSIGFNDAGELAHIMQPGIPEDVSFGEDSSLAFGGKLDILGVRASTHVEAVTGYTIIFPSTLANDSSGGIVKLPGTAPAPLGTASAGTLNGKVAKADHVHSSYPLTMTGESDDRVIYTFSLGDSADKSIDLSDMLKVGPPALGARPANSIFRTSRSDVSVAEWGKLVNTADTVNYSLPDVRPRMDMPVIPVMGSNGIWLLYGDEESTGAVSVDDDSVYAISGELVAVYEADGTNVTPAADMSLHLYFIPQSEDGTYSMEYIRANAASFPAVFDASRDTRSDPQYYGFTVLFHAHPFTGRAQLPAIMLAVDNIGGYGMGIGIRDVRLTRIR